MANGLDVGDFALFVQTQGGDQNVIVRQRIAILATGRYQLSFKYAGRPSHTGATTQIELEDGNGGVTEIGSVTPTTTALQTFLATVTLQAGEYYFQFRQSDTQNGDKANVFEDVVLHSVHPQELLVNGTFEGTGKQPNSNWGAYANNETFSCPGWEFLTPNRAGLGKPNGTWMVSGLDVGAFALFVQTQGFEQNVIVRQKVVIPAAGRYRTSFKYAGRKDHIGATTLVEIVDSNNVVTTVGSVMTDSTALREFFADVMLQAGEYYFRFRQSNPDNSDLANVFEGVSLHPVDSVAVIEMGGVGYATLASAMTASDAGSTIIYHEDGSDDGAITGESMVWSGNMPTIQTVGTLTFNGTNIVTAYASRPGTYKLVEAKSMALENGAAFTLDPACRFRDVNSAQDATYDYRAELITTENAVILHLYNVQTTGNNYYKAASERADDFYITASNWQRGHTPTTGDGEVHFNHPGRIVFDGSYANAASLSFFFRNGVQAPVVFEATDDAFGYDFGNAGEYFRGAQGNGMAGWVDFHSGTYSMLRILMNGSSNKGYESVFRLDVSGATVTSGALQGGYAVDALTQVNVSGGVLTISDYNPNICARTMNRTRVTGGKFILTGNLQACSGLSSVFDCEVTGGEVEVRNMLNVAYTAVNSRGELRLSSGGLVRAGGISAPAGYGRFLFDGGTLAPYAASAAWLDDATLTVAAGKSAVVDTEGKDVVWKAALADDAGGTNFGFTKRGEGALAFAADQTFTGTLAVESGTLVSTTNALAASGASVSRGATLSAADGTPGQTVSLAALALAGGARLAIDLDAVSADCFAFESIDLSDASAASPVVIAVSPIGLAELPAEGEYPVMTGGIAAGDVGKFAVNGVDALLAVKNGALVMMSSNRPKVTTEWSGAANDGGKWSTAGNWTNDTPPQNGDTAAFNLAAGGTTDFDIDGFSLGGIVFGQTAGAFTHGGAGMMRVVNTVTNLSAQVQTFTVPVTLGVGGQSMEVNTVGDLVLTGVTTTAAATLVKKGAGTLSVPDAAVLTASRIEVEGGTLRIDERVGTVEETKSGDIVVKSGGRLDVNASGGNGNFAASETTHSHAVTVEGAGPDGAGALYNSVVDNTWGAFFSKVTLSGDAKTGGGHLSVRDIANSAAGGSEISGPYALTVANSLDTHGFNFHSTLFDCSPRRRGAPA